MEFEDLTQVLIFPLVWWFGFDFGVVFGLSG